MLCTNHFSTRFKDFFFLLFLSLLARLWSIKFWRVLSQEVFKTSSAWTDIIYQVCCKRVRKRFLVSPSKRRGRLGSLMRSCCCAPRTKTRFIRNKNNVVLWGADAANRSFSVLSDLRSSRLNVNSEPGEVRTGSPCWRDSLKIYFYFTVVCLSASFFFSLVFFVFFFTYTTSLVQNTFNFVALIIAWL